MRAEPAYNLDLDFGNTRIKWRLSDAQGIAARGEISRDEVAGELPLPQVDIERLRVASVLGSDATDQLLGQLGLAGQPVTMAQVKSPCDGLVCGYSDPDRLGVDRWLAMLAAWKQWRGEGLVVVDAGSALTVDLVHPDGRHLGGFLVPGLELQRSALLGRTAGVRFDGRGDRELVPGTSTESCVHRGISLSLVALVRAARDDFERSLGRPAILCITGGDRGMLVPHLPAVVEVENLVLDGLAIACPAHPENDA